MKFASFVFSLLFSVISQATSSQSNVDLILQEAFVNENIEKAKDLLASPQGKAYMIMAAKADNPIFLDLFIKAGGDVNTRNSSKDTLLHIAIEAGKTDNANLLLKANAKIKTRDDAGWAPLHSAAFYQQTDILALLIEAGADPNIRTHIGNTALHYIATKGSSGDIELLIEAGADVNAQNVHGETPLELTSKSDMTMARFRGVELNDNIRTLINYGGEVRTSFTSEVLKQRLALFFRCW